MGVALRFPAASWKRGIKNDSPRNPTEKSPKQTQVVRNLCANFLDTPFPFLYSQPTPCQFLLIHATGNSFPFRIEITLDKKESP
jgi:hypothetical protein